jgi:iron complex outermembrane receptor protein
LGAKTAWLDRRITINAAGFFINWNNIQQQVLLSCGFQFIANAGRATSQGGELEFRGRVLEPLELSAGVGYQNAKIADQGIGPQPVGSPIYNVPNWTANTALTYTVPINSSWSMLGVADYSYIGRSFSANNDPSQPRERPSYRLINLRVALEHGPYELALVGKNLANEIENLGDSRSLAQEVPGRPRLFINQPRTIGLEMRASF